MNNSNLFDNNFIKNIEANIDPIQKEKYKKMGEDLYNSVDYVNTGSNNETMPSVMADAIAYILDSLRSGQHISTLENNEKQILKDTYGEEWYKILGYTEKDLTEMITFPKFGTQD
jgi:hypothetical protein